MKLWRATIMLMLCSLSACGRAGMYGREGLAAAVVSDREDLNRSFSYDHFLSLTMPPESISPRFQAARERCLYETRLQCTLISATLDMSDNQYAVASAHLTVALPHARLGTFEQELFAPVAGESPGAAQVHSRSTTAENVTQEASETQKKLAQLTAYRDRLVALEKRPNISVSDSLRIEGELAKVLGDLEAAKLQQRDVANRVGKERRSISLSERPGFSDAFRPVGRVWKDGVQIFGDSTASALQFLIQLIPWLPLVAGGFFFVRWFWRVSRRQRLNAPSSQNSG